MWKRTTGHSHRDSPKSAKQKWWGSSCWEYTWYFFPSVIKFQKIRSTARLKRHEYIHTRETSFSFVKSDRVVNYCLKVSWKQLWDPKKIWLNSILYIFFCAELTHLTGSREAGSLEEACLQMWPDQAFGGGSSRAASKSPINPCPPQKLDCAKSRQATTMSLKNRMSFCFCFLEKLRNGKSTKSGSPSKITCYHWNSLSL